MEMAGTSPLPGERGPSRSAGDAGGAGVGGGPLVERTDLRAELAEGTPPPCPQCGDEAPAAADGSCPTCGAHRPALRDHVELVLGDAAAITDRGLRRRRNEDAVELGRRVEGGIETWVAVVCDGVASARRGDEASLVAVGAAVGAALETAAAPPTPPTGFPAISASDTGPVPVEPAEPPSGRAGTGVSGELDSLATAASAAAATAAADLGRGGGDAPACTYVAAVVRGGDAVVSWIGDSRAYWLAGDGSSRLLSTDDSWAEEIANAGIMSREEAARDRRAHVLTRWLGRDAPSGPAHARRVRVGTPGLLLLCSDGLWNHLPDPAVLARLAAPALSGPPPAEEGVPDHPALAAAAALLAAALDDGGSDNATLALVPVVPPADTDRPSVTVDARGPDERTGPIPLDGPGVVDR
ncbi:PP2C family protein-serine/threonine phosphatase [Actinomycetospora straminea]|uniref:PPM-type phosphatase domain-containing protein n=1 Tax=Actinomycetospora straminea TaxID=663607 RepID=A0ABP9E4K2_9PSEU|nr:protein phosphatase 2C domain-containing protein [Actinomycetospora straminea]